MPKNRLFPPEGLRPAPALTLKALQEAAETGEVLEASVRRCDAKYTLHLHIGRIRAILPREEAIAPWISGSEREISVLSRVGKQTCFTVKSVTSDEKGTAVALLSRREAQEQAMNWFLENLSPGDILTGRITRLDSFGAFVDIGRGIVALLPLESISISRISHPNLRFREGQTILAIVSAIDPSRRRMTLTHKELLGNWLENAAEFAPGETVPGIVRSVRDYGSFVELAPNLSGLADNRAGVKAGDRVSVFIKSIRPEKMKIKLQIVQQLEPEQELPPPVYRITDGHLDHWRYSPVGCEKPIIETQFTAPGP